MSVLRADDGAQERDRRPTILDFPAKIWKKQKKGNKNGKSNFLKWTRLFLEKMLTR